MGRRPPQRAVALDPLRRVADLPVRHRKTHHEKSTVGCRTFPALSSLPHNSVEPVTGRLALAVRPDPVLSSQLRVRLRIDHRRLPAASRMRERTRLEIEPGCSRMSWQEPLSCPAPVTERCPNVRVRATSGAGGNMVSNGDSMPPLALSRREPRCGALGMA